jgi:hypothetical protein
MLSLKLELSATIREGGGRFFRPVEAICHAAK